MGFVGVVLVFVGGKMLLAPHGESHQWFQVEVPTPVTLLVIGLILGTSILLSLRAAAQKSKNGQ